MKINRLFLGITLIFILSSCNQLKDSISNHFSTDINTQEMQRYALIIGN
ncbi:hypothetical protein [Candidatus Marithrix sp. Canyon 246]|nr:hypothetical protein [Candidatus Marithrix sp. Canyon 246]